MLQLRNNISLHLFCLCSIFIAISCKQKTLPATTPLETQSTESTRDISLQLYIRWMDSAYNSHLKIYGLQNETIDLHFLKAYSRNDTAYMKAILSEFQRADQEMVGLDTFLTRYLPAISSLPYEEIYQFKYSETFCNIYYTLTLTKRADSAQLNVFVYLAIPGEQNDSTFYEPLEEKTIPLTASQWNTFATHFTLTDFWNLKANDNHVVYDPPSLTVIGLTKFRATDSKGRGNYVHRQIFRGTALHNTFLLLSKYAGLVRVCDELIY